MPTEVQAHLDVVDWGLIDYEVAYARQLELAEKTNKQQTAGAIVFCTHPPVVTLGRKSERAVDVRGWTGSVVEVNRGGRATYHGPSQLVTYPILNLDYPGVQKQRDIRFYLACLTETWATVLHQEFGLAAEPKYYEKQDAHDLTGVWLKGDRGISQKILSIGIGVKNWCTMHGSALNLFEDDIAFSGISPCGFSAKVMTSVQQEVGQSVTTTQIQNLKTSFVKSFASKWLKDL